MTAPPLFSVEPALRVHALMHMHDQCRHGPARPGWTGSSVDQWQHGANVQSLLTTYCTPYTSAVPALPRTVQVGVGTVGRNVFLRRGGPRDCFATGPRAGRVNSE